MRQSILRRFDCGDLAGTSKNDEKEANRPPRLSPHGLHDRGRKLHTYCMMVLNPLHSDPIYIAELPLWAEIAF